MVFIHLGLILVSLGILGFIFGLKCTEWQNDLLFVLVFTFFIVGVIITLCWAVDRDINPTAMDVYRGKTTLEITYKDGVAIDTVVVFKSKK